MAPAGLSSSTSWTPSRGYQDQVTFISAEEAIWFLALVCPQPNRNRVMDGFGSNENGSGQMNDGSDLSSDAITIWIQESF